MKIKPVSLLKSQMQFETYAKEQKKKIHMVWAHHIKTDFAQKLIKCPNKAKQTIFRIFRNSERNLVMHFHKTCFQIYFIISLKMLDQVSVTVQQYHIHSACDALKSPKQPNSNNIKLTVKKSTVLCPPLYFKLQ